MTAPRADVPDFGPEASEMSWGPGNVPPRLEDAPPNQGGVYRGKAPRLDPDTGSGLRALAGELDQRRRGGRAS